MLLIVVVLELQLVHRDLFNWYPLWRVVKNGADTPDDLTLTRPLSLGLEMTSAR